LSVFYLLYFLAVGVTLPFLPAYFGSLGLTPGQIGLLLSVSPVLSVVTAPLWGHVADRSGRPGLVLLALCVGALAGYSVLLTASTFAAALVAMALYSAFGPSVTPIADSLALAHLARQGHGDYAHLRRWGSLGFVLATLAFGYAVDRVDRLAVLVPIGVLAAAALWCAVALARAPTVPQQGPPPSWPQVWQLVRTKPFAWLLVATTLHWVASTPYHGSLSAHFSSIGLAPWAVGLTAGVAVSSEVVVLSLWPRWAHLLPARALLMATFALSAVRWWGMALTDDVVLLTALASLHGVSFGAFYVASVAEVAKRAPDSLGATGQAVFAAATFGLGGLVGYAGSGALYGLVGGHSLFVLAGCLEVLPLAVVAWAMRPT
jgi:PPP family 3-phenylpropionic acid transporter